MNRAANGTYSTQVHAALDKLPTEFTIEHLARLLPGLRRQILSYSLKNLSMRERTVRIIGSRLIEVPRKDGTLQQVAANLYQKVNPNTTATAAAQPAIWRGPLGITWERGAYTLAAHLTDWPGSPAPASELYA